MTGTLEEQNDSLHQLPNLYNLYTLYKEKLFRLNSSGQGIGFYPNLKLLFEDINTINQEIKQLETSIENVDSNDIKEELEEKLEDKKNVRERYKIKAGESNLEIENVLEELEIFEDKINNFESNLRKRDLDMLRMRHNFTDASFRIPIMHSLEQLIDQHYSGGSKTKRGKTKKGKTKRGKTKKGKTKKKK